MQLDTRTTTGAPTPSGRLPGGRVLAVAYVSLLAALGVGHLVAGLVGPGASPFFAVGDWVRDNSPHAVVEWAKATFGTADKTVLFIGVTVVVLGVTAAAGLLSRTRPAPGLVIAAAQGVLGIVAVLTRPDLGQLAIAAPAASLVVGLVVFSWLHGRAWPVEQDRESRRRFLRAGAGTVIGAAALGTVGQLVGSRVDVEGSRAAVGKLTPVSPAPKLPPGADFAANGTARFITANRDFYRIDTALTLPRVAAQDWRLRIHGLVDKPVEFTFSDIRGRRLIERPVTLACVSNEVGGGLISTANWIGVPLRELLAEAGVKPGADQLFSTSTDGFTAGTPVDAVMDQNRGAMLAIGMNGEPLPQEHGFPARMVVPGLYGYVSATKWVVDMELTTFADKQGYWIPRGWSAKGPIKTQSRIDSPRDGFVLAKGRNTIAGVAWAQTIGVREVEVRFDGQGDWHPAELSTEVGLNTWRMWRVTLDLEAGERTIQVRATDNRGHTQTEDEAPPAPDGATGWHTVHVSVN
ncbi:molybdopterin-dependent oxidoreductase [Actinophytocola algeriensis]|uniref:DMSO/TMAO reductase YedYZ molybdopterin-dependent catalytic subunit n=1 Tax=Actinophytocola algeriensis TaxID=1768010 RepID=A0A7W7QE43_9PSEU|nr:molybdopterin-dependent oxidoreductase [Actinophytocola algeriensis]MBB4911829.1 DMSO/TMAO reductase YedYZ molybdopterin-dependent catalytic subunit [Actinophytocola algeriensis]MBE1477679.1 DMSO/TMAO reductase YedYZ molybdopterin-dependent catalytic subunit [Actinophytocola algeriensis]